MTAGDTDRPRPAWRRWGCLAIGVLLAIPLGYAVLVVLISMGIRECNPPTTISHASDASAIVLDADHPVFEQDVTVHVPASALPDQRRAHAVTLDVEPVIALAQSPSQRPTSSEPSNRSPGVTAGIGRDSILFVFVHADTGEVISRVATPGPGRNPFAGQSLAGITLDCQPNTDCNQSLRIVASIPRGTIGHVEVTWDLRATISWGFDGCSGPPYAATPTVAVGPPIVGDANNLTDGDVPIRADEGLIVARHVRVSTEAAPEVAYGHLFVRRTGTTPWTPWVRVIPDAAALGGSDAGLVLDAPFGDRYGGPVEQLADFPILTGCQTGTRCERGYWIVVQAKPAADFGLDLAWKPEPSVGAIEWALTAIGSSVRTGSVSAPMDLVVDEEPPDLGPRPVLETNDVRFDLDADVERYIDITIQVPQPEVVPAGQPDWRRSAEVVATAHGFGVAHGYRLEGSGAGPFVGGASGDSTTALIGHPFDGCVLTAPCETVVRMVGALNPDPHSSMSGIPNITFRLAVLGAPPGTTASIGQVGERRRSEESGLSVKRSDDGGGPVQLIVVVVVILVAAGVLFAVLASRRRRAVRP